MSVVETVPQSLQQYLDLLVGKSAEGKLPAVEGVSGKDGKRCRYRTADGRACAVGLLIRDDKYRPEFEGNGVYDIYLYEKKLLPAFITHDDLEEVQALHDRLAIASRTGWDHQEWVDGLLSLDVFRGMTPSQETA